MPSTRCSPRSGPEHARWLSVLPLHLPAGLLLDLLPALLGAQEVARPTDGDEAPVGTLPTPSNGGSPHAPCSRGRWRASFGPSGGTSPRWRACSAACGPGLDAGLAADLRRTRLRTHRGAPELSCMVTLGEPGIGRLGALGRPVGCVIEDGPGGGLLVSGRPAAGGRWVEGSLLPVDRGSPVVVALS